MKKNALGTVAVIILVVLFVALMTGLFVIIVHAIKQLPTHNGEDNDTNAPSSFGSTLYISNNIPVYQQWTTVYIVKVSSNLLEWRELYTQVEGDFNWQMPVDKTNPCEFFKITIYGTNLQ